MNKTHTSNEHREEDWDPRDASTLKDQRRAYDEMRERCPVAHSAFLGWSLFRHKDIAGVLADSEAFSNASRFLAVPNGMDPPVHGRYHDALAAFFGDAKMIQFESHVREIAVKLIAPMVSGGEAECIEGFATPFALKSLCAVLGWPDHESERLAGWVHGNQQAAFNRDPAAGKALAALFSEHVRANLDRHRSSPMRKGDATDDLLSTAIDGKVFSDDEIISILRNWAAGHGTVEGGLGILIMHLATASDLQDRLRGDPSLIPAAVEEILRVDGPLVANRRTTTRDVEIHDRTIPQGESVTLMWTAANRDPRAFDNADAIELERRTEAGLVWGQGIHICLGAPLARLEMRVALEELLARTKCIELAAAPPRRDVYPSNGFAALHLRFS